MDTIRITSGQFRGRSIKSPQTALTHPMGSREKIALMNMISPYLKNAFILDAFAGSGALGIEALSHGAKKVVFVEKNRATSKIIAKNLSTLGLSEKSQVLTTDVSNFIANQEFDIIIADPPYDNFEPATISHLTKYLKNGGTFVLSHPDSAPAINDLTLTKTRKYAGAHISIYQK